MSLNVAETRQAFPFPYDQVFDGLVAVLGPAGFPIKSQDRVIGRIAASAGASAFSWGEDVIVQVQRTGDRSTDLVIQSNLKVGFNVTGTSKNTQNAERIIATLSNYLQSDTKDVQQSVAAAPQPSYSPVLWIIAIVVGLLVMFAILQD